MKKILLSSLVILGFHVNAQNKSIVKVIDNLTVKWDETAIRLKNYQLIQEFCLTPSFKSETIELLDEIHHWDTTLYFIVQEKFDINEDKEAAATLADIEKLETEYSTINFKAFIQKECDMLKVINDSFDQQTVKKFEKDIRAFEKELVKYINSITYRIDIIDVHVHHLHLE
ncbi:MAG: hypothetical protein HRT61_24545 [Ekhidna sp.]|nr:hypothetical protein [Ekhidna sp.]